jgi:hypothetical protein
MGRSRTSSSLPPLSKALYFSYYSPSSSNEASRFATRPIDRARNARPSKCLRSLKVSAICDIPNIYRVQMNYVTFSDTINLLIPLVL